MDRSRLWPRHVASCPDSAGQFLHPLANFYQNLATQVVYDDYRAILGCRIRVVGARKLKAKNLV